MSEPGNGEESAHRIELPRRRKAAMKYALPLSLTLLGSTMALAQGYAHLPIVR